METVFTRDTKVRDIVIRVPRSDELFKTHKIDFCCGGNRPIHEAIEEKGLDEASILTSLQSLYDQAVDMKALDEEDWTSAPYSILIDHVIHRHHRYLVEELPDLSFYVTKIFRVHGDSHPELAELHRLYHSLKTELEHHMVKEEQFVFPAIRQYDESNMETDRSAALSKIDELEAEHEEAGNLLKQMRQVTSDFTLPEGACTTYKMTFQRLEQLESDMFQHVHLENNIMFPRLAGEA
ncbi:iron-sulfur cluster repair di-iron protein [Evansella cellulosilytica]|uniref:Iron-sulfur cluster repair di-iron protein n=1 Tax=Evansella cellulosilytica (strain ATCC 21833 / DSM 2522 / FERM P-1141 / JCM 9156 / N-4) TaxID=649639 RepID=E6U253_EVAC2|nr:iron-sulfur cluster repair di-iron protein [Evansella cellulosilytica]ADU30431.1 iron-sulfur cluster repair di-iron protein [Evansella cellulosilytica DSM 2522]